MRVVIIEGASSAGVMVGNDAYVTRSFIKDLALVYGDGHPKPRGIITAEIQSEGAMTRQRRRAEERRAQKACK